MKTLYMKAKPVKTTPLLDFQGHWSWLYLSLAALTSLAALYPATNLAKGLALASSPPKLSQLIALAPVTTDGLEQPVFLTSAEDHSGRLFILEQTGRIRIVEHGNLLPTPFLDISFKVRFGGEMGLLGLAFHPKYRENGRYVVNYTRSQDGATVISEFRVSLDPSRSSIHEKILLIIPQPYNNHNGGMLAFGPEGFLYIGMGDGGSAGDPGDRGQNPTNLLGKILRIDLDHGSPYTIPKNNPFFSRKRGREIFATGFRNPWRFSFDRGTGKLWAADVGQNGWEEINIVEKGKNYGWRIMEGTHCFWPKEGCRQDNLAQPAAEYQNTRSRCSVIGGYIYRGRLIPKIYGTYVFGDYCSGEILGLVDGKLRILLSTNLKISSFGEDEYRNLYVINHEGSVSRLTPSSP